MNLVVMVLLAFFGLVILAFFGLVILGELARELVCGVWAWVSYEWDGLVYAYAGRSGRVAW